MVMMCTYTAKKSAARSMDFPDYVGESYSIKTILEPVLRFP
jgi:hypothetical protein